MNLLNRITIRSRLWGGSALMLLLFLAFGLFSLQEMRQMDRLTWKLYEHPFQVSNAALLASIGVSNMQGAMRQAVLARSASEIALAVQEVREAQHLAFDNLEAVRNRILGAEGKALEQGTRELLDSWLKIAEETLQLVRQGKTEAASALTLGQGDELFNRLGQRLLELRNYAGNKAKGSMQNASEQQRQIYRHTVMFMVIATMLAVFLAVFLIRNSLGDLAALQETMASITQTGNLEKSSVRGSNEIADMAQHFNGLVDRLQFRFWLKDGLGALNSELSGDLPIDQLATRGLTFISRYVEGCAGAFYAWANPDSTWELKASFALGEGTCFAPRFKEGEGIVGQVAAEKQAIFLEGIGRDEAVALSGTVNTSPRSIYAVPLLHQGEMFGVLEVAWFTDIDGGKREFLNAAAFILAVSLFAATRKDHIQRLLTAAQEANEELTVMNEELQVQSEELRAQAEELRVQTEELASQRLQVEEADRLKSEFLSNMSHELRTPLNSILALTQLMIAQGTEKDAAQEAKYLQVIERNGRHLLNLINDILDLSRIESGRVQLALAEADPGQICTRALETIRPLAAEKGLELKADYGDLPRMFIDEDKLHQILINLLSNAVKFTDQGEIELQVSGAGDRMEFVVRDTGIGISPEALPYIFDQFRQVDGSSTRRFNGTGLGLAICRSLATILGGEIRVESEVGKGSTFILTLPRRCPESQETVAAPLGPRPLPPPLTPAPLRRGQPLVLIVEDDPIAAMQIRTVLEEQDYAVQVAPNGAEALTNLQRMRPDCIILDLMMPEIDGFEVLKQIRALPQIAATPVLVLTAKELTRDDRAQLAHNHIQQLVQKGSLNREELGACVRRLLMPTAAVQSQVSHTGGSILVVENDPDNLLVITAILDEAGYNYVTATDGNQAVVLARQTPPALILMDVQLPGVDGLEVAQQIKADSRLAEIPIVGLTAMAMRGQREGILAAGMDDYLAKPFKPQDLIHMVRRWLG